MPPKNRSCSPAGQKNCLEKTTKNPTEQKTENIESKTFFGPAGLEARLVRPPAPALARKAILRVGPLPSVRPQVIPRVKIDILSYIGTQTTTALKKATPLCYH